MLFLWSTRQQHNIELIASENFVSRAVLGAVVLFNHKYAEGYPGKRYYGGCEFVDVVESWPFPGPELFRVDHANVQPHSGAQPTWRLFCPPDPGYTLGIKPVPWGALTHGHPINISGSITHCLMV